MRIQFSRAILAAAISSTLGLGAAWGQAQQKQPNWKDRAEYDLVQAIEAEKDPNKKIELLNQWKEKYPTSDFKITRLEKFVTTYAAAANRQKALETAQEILTEDPKNTTAVYYINLLIVGEQPTPANLDLGEKAAKTLLGNLDEVFALEKKPASTPESAWKQARLDLEALGHRTLGWVHMQRKNYEEAEKELTQNLKIHPNDAEASYWLGTVILAQKKPERQSDALFQFARAAAYDGPGAIEPKARKQIQEYITRNYTMYHGEDPEGLRNLLNLAKNNAFPPEGFVILSEAEVIAQKEKELEASNPSLALWVRLKSALTGEDGAQYFEGSMKDALVPPEDQPAFTGHVISQDGTRAARSVVLGISDPNTPEVTLKFETPLPGVAAPGTKIQFRGVAREFTREPFMVTFEAEKKDIIGWPEPPPAKKASKKAAKK
ncbi:MAG TPA: tetratricopeptide repeat protein [Bryobacteraceae bacterium]|nr:tetratricopeptide repeat protein [Bryobacteraceae bacterium]HOL73773.1 tetratricopeptide repeat protein [Bryobacteraceae bacterium]HOQ45652.1 tetratricopeptide repeat protein [Bryobacteraceae bacterium]HPQ16503.1 tetratricopeptide repeat protein [Bryobacteraceae bacterium]HPU71622.1 tetratricopeptide repeat protein [Bryobacteraceae bacterium]